MTLTEKHVSGLTLKLLSKINNKDVAKNCSIDMLNVLEERDQEWCDWLKANFNISVEMNQLNSLYKEAKKAVNLY